MTELKEVLIKDIHPDPNQPRRFYDEQAMDELTESIKDSGVIQPIVIRPNGKGYIIVCGERRYRAALSVNAAFKDRNTIPAVIRNLSDEEALQLQIVENLQRKDVHPMEEAVAFKSLLEKKQWSVNEIAPLLQKRLPDDRCPENQRTFGKGAERVLQKRGECGSGEKSPSQA